MSYPWLLYENHLSGTLTASSEAAGGEFDVENIQDYRPFVTQWKPNDLGPQQYVYLDAGAGNTVQPDTAVIIDHNLSNISASGVSWQVQYSDDAINWTGVGSAVVPTNDKLTYQEIDPVSGHRFWRIFFQNQTPGNTTNFISIGHIHLGRRLTFPEGLQPGWEPMPERAVQVSPRSQGGVFLGTTLRYVERRFALNWDSIPGIASSFFEDGAINMENFWKNHAGRGPTNEGPLPFIFAWDTDREDPFFCRIVDGTTFSSPWGPTYKRRGLNLEVEAYVEIN